jgi:plasmid stabilization system protein ParE|tara:strand:+ start:554 stop:883 length:330 start_codon:yes stop_codon:yes gene_type:complete
MKIVITNQAQLNIKNAIEWMAKKTNKEQAKEYIKGIVTDWKNQMLVAPESGKVCQYLISDVIRESIKGDYRFTYEIENKGGELKISLLIFCHTKMDYQTLLRNANHPHP